MSMKLPDDLEFITDEYGVKVFGMGPYTCYVRNKITHRVYRIVIPYPPLDQENLPQFFVTEFERALKEQLDADTKRRQPDSEHDADVREEGPV